MLLFWSSTSSEKVGSTECRKCGIWKVELLEGEDRKISKQMNKMEVEEWWCEDERGKIRRRKEKGERKQGLVDDEREVKEGNRSCENGSLTAVSRLSNHSIGSLLAWPLFLRYHLYTVMYNWLGPTHIWRRHFFPRRTLCNSHNLL